MLSVDLFAEDRAHEQFIRALLRRVLGEERAPHVLSVRSAVGGHGRALSELRTYQNALARGIVGLTRPDLLVVAIDGNCRGPNQARREIEDVIDRSLFTDLAIACPDPHIERWFFADPSAFRRVIGVTARPGARKCERDRYKRLLEQAIAGSGQISILGGIEFSDELVEAFDLYRAGQNEPTFGALVDDVRAFARRRGIKGDDG